MAKKKTAWGIVTPLGKIELDSVRDTRVECIRDFVLHKLYGGLRGDIKNTWREALEAQGYRCVKVTIEVLS